MYWLEFRVLRLRKGVAHFLAALKISVLRVMVLLQNPHLTSPTEIKQMALSCGSSDDVFVKDNRLLESLSMFSLRRLFEMRAEDSLSAEMQSNFGDLGDRYANKVSSVRLLYS